MKRLKYLFFIIIVSVAVGTLLSQQNPTKGLVLSKTGQVFVIRGGQRIELHVNDRLQQGDELETMGGSTVSLQLSNGVACQIGSSTRMQIDRFSRSGEVVNARFNLLNGSVATGARMPPGSSIQVATPTSIASVRGTEFIVEAANSTTTNVLVNNGTVNVQSGENQTDVPAGQKVVADTTGVHQAILDKFDQQKFEIFKQFEAAKKANLQAVIDQLERNQQLIQQQRENSLPH